MLPQIRHRLRSVGVRGILRQIVAIRRRAAAASLALGLAWPGDVYGQSGRMPESAMADENSVSSAAAPTLAEPALIRRLSQPVTLAWTDQQLAAGLARLGEVQNLPLWLDRRVDAGREIDLAINNRPLVEVLSHLANERGDPALPTNVGWTALRSVVYVGPADAAREMATLSELARQAIAKAPADVRRRWLTPAPWEFPRLSEPRTLLDDAVAATGAKLRGGSELPHDLWPARSLPAVAPLDRVVLLLAGFDRQAEISADGESLRAVPIKRPVQLSRTLPIGQRVDAEIARLIESDGSARVERHGRQVTVFARWEQLEQLRGAPRGRASQTAGRDAAPAPGSEQRFTLRIANKPVGPVLAQLATQLQLTIAWDPALTAASPKIADTLISCEASNADLDSLLAAILEPAGLAFDRSGQSVTIRARQ
jgi:hypothetical protein